MGSERPGATGSSKTPVNEQGSFGLRVPSVEHLNNRRNDCLLRFL